MSFRRATEEDIQEIEKAFHTVHQNLQWMPEKYCCWKKKSSDGRVISKSLYSDYRPVFNFVKNKDLRNNLSELRFCFDYHHSLFKLLSPGLTFGWQHKLVLCQITAGIYEGLLFDLFEILAKNKSNPLQDVIIDQKLKNKNFGFGGLIETFNEAGLLKNWYKYLINMNKLRNTIHPKYLNNEDTSFQKNPIIGESIDKLESNLSSFIEDIKKLYP